MLSVSLQLSLLSANWFMVTRGERWWWHFQMVNDSVLGCT